MVKVPTPPIARRLGPSLHPLSGTMPAMYQMTCVFPGGIAAYWAKRYAER